MPLKVTVKAFGPIIDLLGPKRTVELQENASIEDLTNNLMDSLKTRDDHTKKIDLLHSDLIILVNGRNLRSLADKRLKQGDFIAFLSPFGGG